MASESVFCEHCGTKIINTDSTEKVSDNIKKATATIQDTDLRSMAGHLEFLGYQIEREENDQKVEVITATHLTNNNFTFLKMLTDHALFKVSLRADKKPTPEMDVAINQINKVLLISRVYYDTDGKSLEVIRLEATYSNEYDKEKFARFLEILERDQQLMVQAEDFKAFLDE